MASTSETGHSKNVTNFENLTTSIAAWGKSYNPSKTSITLPAMQLLITTSQESLNGVNKALSAYSNAVAARATAFKPFGQLITRVSNALKSSDTTTQVDESAQSIIRKLRGKRASAKLTDEEKKSLAAEGKEFNQISTSQMSYDSQLENFNKLITFLTSVPLYNPNEEELKTDNLLIFYNDLKAKNSAVIKAASTLSNARIARNEILYKPLTGLVDIASDSKTYIKSLFGSTSPQYKQISKLEFKPNKQ